MVVAQIGPVVFDAEERGFLVREIVVGAEREERDRVPICQSMGGSKLVVPIGNRVVGGDERREQAGVSVPACGENTASPIVDGRFGESVRVEDASAELASRRVGPAWRRRCFAGDHGAREAPVASGVGTRKEVDRVDDSWSQGRWPRAHMKQQRHSYSVNEVTDVLGGRAADLVIRQTAQPGRHSWKRLDDSKWIAERARHEARLGSRDVVRTGFLALASDRNFHRLSLWTCGYRGRVCWPRCRYRFGMIARNGGPRGVKRHRCDDASGDRDTIARGGPKLPSSHCGCRRLGERRLSLTDLDLRNQARRVHEYGELHRCVALAVGGVDHGGRVEPLRRNDAWRSGRRPSRPESRRCRQRSGKHSRLQGQDSSLRHRSLCRRLAHFTIERRSSR